MCVCIRYINVDFFLNFKIFIVLSFDAALDFIQLVKRVCICFMNNFLSMLVQYCCCCFKHSSWNWNENYSEINQTDNVDGVAQTKMMMKGFISGFRLSVYFSIPTFPLSLSKYWNLLLSLFPLFPFPICACVKLHTLTSFYILVIEMTHTLSHTQMQTQNHLEML